MWPQVSRSCGLCLWAAGGPHGAGGVLTRVWLDLSAAEGPTCLATRPAEFWTESMSQAFGAAVDASPISLVPCPFKVPLSPPPQFPERLPKGFIQSHRRLPFPSTCQSEVLEMNTPCKQP